MIKNNILIKIKYILLSLIVIMITAIIRYIFTYRNISTWYQIIVKPSILLPNYIFSIIWSLLFILMIISFYLILNTKLIKTKIQSDLKKKALNLFLIQLVFNIFWIILFFEFKFLTIAFLDILFLQLLIVNCIFVFFKINKTAAILLIPYGLGVFFIAILNLFNIILN